VRLWLLIIFFLIIPIEFIYSKTEVLFNLNDPKKFERVFFDAISQAKKYLKIVTFNLDYSEFERLLIEKSKNNVSVFLVVDDSKSLRTKYLQNFGIQVLDDEHSKEHDGLIHSKFVIVDGKIAWFGSTNITTNSFFKDHNFYFITNNEDLIKAFEEEFNNFLMLKFHNSKIKVSQMKRNISVFFSPVDDVSFKIAEALSRAKEEVYVCVYAFTNFNILNQLKILASNGIKIRIILDEDWNLYSGFKYSVLENSTEFFEVRLDPFDGLLHDKFIIIDPRKNGMVIAGSYNFTMSANIKNDEFCVFIKSKNILEEFRKEFERIWVKTKTF